MEKKSWSGVIRPVQSPRKPAGRRLLLFRQPPAPAFAASVSGRSGSFPIFQGVGSSDGGVHGERRERIAWGDGCSRTDVPHSGGERQRPAVVEGWRDGCPAAGMPAEAICSGDWFAQIFTTKARRHKEKPGTPPEQRPFLNRRFRRWRRCGNRGGKKELVGGDSTRTIAAKAGGTEASPFPPAAGPRIRGERLRSLALLPGFSARQVIGRKSSLRMSQRAPQGDVLSRTDVLFSEWRTVYYGACRRRYIRLRSGRISRVRWFIACA